MGEIRNIEAAFLLVHPQGISQHKRCDAQADDYGRQYQSLWQWIGDFLSRIRDADTFVDDRRSAFTDVGNADHYYMQTCIEKAETDNDTDEVFARQQSVESCEDEQKTDDEADMFHNFDLQVIIFGLNFFVIAEDVGQLGANF